MANVFLSHASDNRETTLRVRDFLRDDGHDVFVDLDGMTAGVDWEQRLYERLRWADAVVCMVTSAYADSSWGSAEVGIARAQGCRVIPVLTEPGVVHPLLPPTLQHVDLVADEQAARADILEALQEIDIVGPVGWPDDRSPFPGLHPFTGAYRPVFFGREREIEELARNLRTPAHRTERSVLLLVGPSGCGKSSLVQAGLLPRLASETDWRTVPPMRPGREPTAALASLLAVEAQRVDLHWTVAETRDRLDERGLAEMAAELLLAAPAPRPQRLLITVDQFEELVTQTDAEERGRFAALLRAGLTGPVHVVGTLRPEFLDQILVDPELVDLPARTSMIRPLHGDALRQIIEKPARRAGIEIDDGLVSRLVEDTGGGEALPLLAFTLAELANGVTRGGRLLNSRYEQLGGVKGALIRQADAALADAVAAGGRPPDAVVQELLRLITVDEANQPVRWPVRRAEISAAGLVELDCFVAHRLLFAYQDTDEHDNDVVMLSVVHEYFLTGWPPLRQAIKEAAVALRARREVEQGARLWVEAQPDQAAHRLWTGDRLAAALVDLGSQRERSDTGGWWRRLARPATPFTERARIGLSDDARVFLRASHTRDRRQRQRAMMILSGLLVLALVAAGLAGHQWSVVQEQRDAAIHARIVSEADRLDSIDVSLAAQLDVLAHQLRPTPELRTALVNLAEAPLSTPLAGFRDSVNAVDYRPDGQVLASVDESGALRMWDLADPGRPVQLGPDRAVDPEAGNTVVFSPNGRLLATGGDDDTIKLWDVRDPADPVALGSPLAGHTGSVQEIAFSPDGRLLVSGGVDKTIRLWDVGDPAAARPIGAPLADHPGIVRTVAIRPDGRVLASGANDGTLRLWDISDPTRPVPIGQPLVANGSFYVLSAAFSPDGTVLATGHGDDAVRLWNVADPAAPAQLGQPITEHTDFVNSVEFSPDGGTLATGSGDRTVRLWNVTNPAAVTSLGPPMNAQATVGSVAFSPDGRQLASADQDPEVQLWRLPDLLLTSAVGQSQRYSHAIRVAPNGRHILSGASDGSVRRWDAADPTRPVEVPQRLLGHSEVTGAVDISPDGRLLASGSDDRTVRLWDISDPAHPAALGGPLGGATDSVMTVAFSPVGRILASGDRDGRVWMWDISDPTRPTPLGDPLIAHPDNSVNSLVFTPDGRTLATASGDFTVRLWNVADPAHPVPAHAPLTEHSLYVNQLALSADKRLLASGSADGTVRLWDIADPARVVPVGQPLDQGNPVFALAFSHDGATLASGGADNTIHLWDLTDPARGVQIGRPLHGHTDSISGLAFSPDGATLLSGSRDQAIRVWDLDLDRVIRTICASTGSPLTEDNWNQVVSPDLRYRQPCVSPS